MYIANTSRPDISYAIGKLSRFNRCPSLSHWEALDRVLRYLRGTMSYGLHYSRFSTVLEGYSDASWITDSVNRKGTSGYIFMLGGAAVAWRSSKQTVITRSTMEAEIVALDSASQEAEWFKNLMSEIPIMEKPIPAISLLCDNEAAINTCRNTEYNKRNRRHISVRHKTIRYLIKNGIITSEFVRSKDNLADPLTKGLARSKVIETSRGMGLKPIKNH